MAFEQQLRIPGPTPLPQRVVRAQSRPMINHRGPEFVEMFAEIISGLKRSLRTENDVLLFPASGTGGLEAAVANLLSPGESTLFCTVGAFGERWAKIARSFGAEVVHLAMPWGESLDPDDIDRTLAEHPDIDTVFVTHNETSTGVTTDIAAIAAVVKGRGKLLAVDSVSGAGCLPLEVDALGLDVVVTGSQKGWMAPPGLTMISVSAAAYERSAKATCARWYFDFAREKRFQDKHQTATTPPLSVLYALHEGLRLIEEEGIENVWARHARVGAMVRTGVTAIGLELFATEGFRSNTVTAIRNPSESADTLKHLLATLNTKHGLILAGGQRELQGHIFRIGHLGMVDDSDVYAILATLELALANLGMLSRTGLSVAAAQTLARFGDGATQPTPIG